jgi:hypothetical protein
VDNGVLADVAGPAPKPLGLSREPLLCEEAVWSSGEFAVRRICHH